MERNKKGDQDWTPAWLNQVRRRVRRWCASDAGSSWVVAVSGGGDSVALVRGVAQAGAELGLTLSVAHLDHGVRGDAARADAAFVHDLAGSMGLPLDLGAWQPTRTGHFEADAAGPGMLGSGRLPSLEAPRRSRSDTRATTRLRRSCTGSSGVPGYEAWRVCLHNAS